MEGHDLLKTIPKVKAPPDFERSVIGRLEGARREYVKRRMTFRYAFAGSAAVFLVGFILLNIFVWDGTGGPTVAGTESPLSQGLWLEGARDDSLEPFIPVLEAVDYSAEVRYASDEPRTVYILEQVSEVSSSGIKY